MGGAQMGFRVPAVGITASALLLLVPLPPGGCDQEGLPAGGGAGELRGEPT